MKRKIFNYNCHSIQKKQTFGEIFDDQTILCNDESIIFLPLGTEAQTTSFDETSNNQSSHQTEFIFTTSTFAESKKTTNWHCKIIEFFSWRNLPVIIQNLPVEIHYDRMEILRE